MPLSPSHCRCGDQFGQPNSLRPPKLHTPIEQIPHESHNTETSDSFCSPALHDFHTSSSSHEPPETEPAFIQSLWNEVSYSESTYNALLDVSIMESSTSGVSPQEYDPQGFSSPAFAEVLQHHQVTIREDFVVSPNLGTSFWAWFCGVVSAAPVEVVSELESFRVWEDNTEGTKAEAEAEAEVEDLVTKLKALAIDRESALIDRQQFVTLQILPRCALPGFRVYNRPEMFDVCSEPYHFLPTRKSPTPSISTQSSTGKSARPTSSITPSINLSKAVPRRTALPNTAPPTKINPPILRELDLPRDAMDYAYWLEASELWPSVGWLPRQTFVSSGTVRKTSPYLSVVFENSDYQSFTEKKLLVKHKIAVYGSTALYNRRLLSIKAAKVGRDSNRSACDIHFGLVVLGSEARLYMFQCAEEKHMVVAWHGCSMYTVGDWILTAPNELADMLSRLRIVADWVRRVYVPGLRDDLIQLSKIFGY